MVLQPIPVLPRAFPMLGAPHVGRWVTTFIEYDLQIPHETIPPVGAYNTIIANRIPSIQSFCSLPVLRGDARRRNATSMKRRCGRLTSFRFFSPWREWP